MCPFEDRHVAIFISADKTHTCKQLKWAYKICNLHLHKLIASRLLKFPSSVGTFPVRWFSPSQLPKVKEYITDGEKPKKCWRNEPLR